MGYSPVCVFLSRAQLFCNEWPGFEVLFLGREVRIQDIQLDPLEYSYKLHFHSVTACVCKDKRILSS